MKFKNYKSAIHNFAHSFMSIDIIKSGRFAINVLIDLRDQGIETKTTFDFLNRTITPDKAISKRSLKLLDDYINWLPEHFEKHNCDLSKLEKLQVTIWTDFSEMAVPRGMSNCSELTISTSTRWKAIDRDEEIIEISQLEVIKTALLKHGIPEVT